MPCRSYQIVQDDQCRWYVIPVTKSNEFQEWCCDEDDWDTPDYAKLIDGPHSISFIEWSEH